MRRASSTSKIDLRDASTTGAWWRHEVDQPETSYRWVRCKKDPKTEEYIPARAVVIGVVATRRLYPPIDRLDRCAGGGFFNLCDQTNEPVTFELSGFERSSMELKGRLRILNRVTRPRPNSYSSWLVGS